MKQQCHLLVFLATITVTVTVASSRTARILPEFNNEPDLVLEAGYPGWEAPKFKRAPQPAQGRFLYYRKNPKVEKYRSAVHELYMRPYNYVSYEMGGSSPSQYRYQYHTPSSSSSSSSYPSYSSYNKEPEPVSYPSYQPSTNHATFHPPPVAALEPEPSSSYPAPKSSYPSFSVFQNTPYSFHDFDTKLAPVSPAPIYPTPAPAPLFHSTISYPAAPTPAPSRPSPRPSYATIVPPAYPASPSYPAYPTPAPSYPTPVPSYPTPPPPPSPTPPAVVSPGFSFPPFLPIYETYNFLLLNLSYYTTLFDL